MPDEWNPDDVRISDRRGALEVCGRDPEHGVWRAVERDGAADYACVSAELPRPQTVAQDYDVHTAKTKLPRLLKQVERGEQVIVARHGRPVARLVPASQGKRVLGSMRGLITERPGWDAPIDGRVPPI